MTRITSIVAALSLAAVVGCSKESKDEASAPNDRAEAPSPTTAKKMDVAVKADAAKAAIGKLTADELDGLIQSHKVSVFDSNGAKVRDEHGKIPSAVLLSHYAEYEVSELPDDKAQKLVFYCSNTQCGASKKSATRALAAGYSPDTAPRDAEWGERYFHITDPDGHELSFARPLKR